MKLVHKILYSLFGFFVCAFNTKTTQAATTGYGKIYGTHSVHFVGSDFSFFCCKAATGEYCGSNHATNTCSDGVCTVLPSGSYSGVTVSYDSVWGLNLYGCSILEYGCTGNEYFTGSGCADCTGAYTQCDSEYTYHKKTDCKAGCAKNYWYDGTSSTCTACPMYSSGGVSLTGLTQGCAKVGSASVERCYVSGELKDARGTYSVDMCFFEL